MVSEKTHQPAALRDHVGGASTALVRDVPPARASNASGVYSAPPIGGTISFGSRASQIIRVWSHNLFEVAEPLTGGQGLAGFAVYPKNYATNEWPAPASGRRKNQSIYRDKKINIYPYVAVKYQAFRFLRLGTIYLSLASERWGLPLIMLSPSSYFASSRKAGSFGVWCSIAVTRAAFPAASTSAGTPLVVCQGSDGARASPVHPSSLRL